MCSIRVLNHKVTSIVMCHKDMSNTTQVLFGQRDFHEHSNLSILSFANLFMDE